MELQNSKNDRNFKLKFGGSEQIGFFGAIKTMQNNAKQCKILEEKK